MCTATGCSRRSTRSRTRSRTHFCGRGVTAKSFDGSTLLRAWLYRIATNVRLDMLRSRSRHPTTMHSYAEDPWLQPYPDRLLDEVASGEEQPDEIAAKRETIGLAFLAALRVLPPRQRATLIARDVIGWPAGETATREPSPEERALLDQFIDAHERCDAAAAIAIAAQDLRITMPPYPMCFDGAETLGPTLVRALGEGDWRLVPTLANRMPTAGSYLRRPGDSEFRAFKFDVLRIRGDRIAEITTFGPDLVPAFGLAPTL